MAVIDLLVKRVFRSKAEKIETDSARMELDALSGPRFQRVIDELDKLENAMRSSRRNEQTRLVVVHRAEVPRGKNLMRRKSDF
jgi:hypothetical protein